MVFDFRTDAGAVVGNRKQHQGAGFGIDMPSLQFVVPLNIHRLDRQLSPQRHSVSSVDDEVHENLLDLPRIGSDGSQARVQEQLQLNIFANQAPEHFAKALDERVQVDDFGYQHLPAAESQQLA